MECWNFNSHEAIAAVVKLAGILIQNNLSLLSDDEIISMSSIIPLWSEGEYSGGISTFGLNDQSISTSIRRHNGQIWKCIQSHDSTDSPEGSPDKMRLYWVPYHAKSKDLALDWVEPTYVEDDYYLGSYMYGEYMKYKDGHTYLCNKDETIMSPDLESESWSRVD